MAYIADVDAQDMRFFQVGGPPNLSEDLAVGEDLTSVGGQQAEEFVLRGGEGHDLAAQCCLSH